MIWDAFLVNETHQLQPYTSQKSLVALPRNGIKVWNLLTLIIADVITPISENSNLLGR